MHWYYWVLIAAALYAVAAIGFRQWIEFDTNREIRRTKPHNRKYGERHL